MLNSIKGIRGKFSVNALNLLILVSIFMMPTNPPPLLVIVGPTAVGKTALSLEIGRRFDGEIISADSRLFYRGMDIGTAKPTPAEQAAIPHHLIDICNPDQTLSLGEYQDLALAAIKNCHQRGKLPILIGHSTGSSPAEIAARFGKIGWGRIGTLANPARSHHRRKN